MRKILQISIPPNTPADPKCVCTYTACPLLVFLIVTLQMLNLNLSTDKNECSVALYFGCIFNYKWNRFWFLTTLSLCFYLFSFSFIIIVDGSDKFYCIFKRKDSYRDKLLVKKLFEKHKTHRTVKIFYHVFSRSVLFESG